MSDLAARIADRIAAMEDGKLDFSHLGFGSLKEVTPPLPEGVIELNLRYNQVTDIKDAGLPETLQTLDLSFNQISDIKDAQLPNCLQTLNLGDNRISDIKDARLPESLQALNLVANPISDIKDAGLPETLQTLNLTGNKISDIKDAQLPNSLQTLDLKNNTIHDIKDARLPDTLRTLNLADNQINDIKDARLPDTLQTLNLSGNNIYGIANARLPETLQTLDLAGNKIWRIKYTRLPETLQTLHLAENQISDITDVRLPERLRNLYLHANKISDIKDARLPESLQTLNLSFNPISDVAGVEQLIRSLPNLTELALTAEPTLGIDKEVLETKDPARILAFLQSQGMLLPELKVALIGEAMAGKSTLMHLLCDPTSPPDPDIDRTRSFESMPLELPVAPQIDTHVVHRPGDQLHIRFNLFDFGGQQFLWNSHRYFLSNDRTIYLIVVDITQDPEHNRLHHWIGFVEDLHRQWLMNEAKERVRADSAADPGFAAKQALPRILEELRDTRARPPIIIVPTGCSAGSLIRGVPRSRNRISDRTLEALHKLVSGRSDLALIDGFDAFDRATHHKLDDIRNALAAAAARMPEVWRFAYPKSTLDMIREFRQCFDHKDPADRDISVERSHPKLPRMSFQQAIDLIKERSAAVQGDDTIEPLLYLKILRNLGVVHWLGDRLDLEWDQTRVNLLRARHSAANHAWNPEWIRWPTYRLLWLHDGRMPHTDRLEYSASELIKRMNAPLLASDQGPTISEVQARETIQFMHLCDLLVFTRTGEADGEDYYLIPDHIPPGSHENHAPPRAEGSFEFSYLDPLAIIQLFARLHRDRAPGTAITRHAISIQSGIGSAPVLVELEEPANASQHSSIWVRSFADIDELAHEQVIKVMGMVRGQLSHHLLGEAKEYTPKRATYTRDQPPPATHPQSQRHASEDLLSLTEQHLGIFRTVCLALLPDSDRQQGLPDEAVMHIKDIIQHRNSIAGNLTDWQFIAVTICELCFAARCVQENDWRRPDPGQFGKAAIREWIQEVKSILDDNAIVQLFKAPAICKKGRTSIDLVRAMSGDRDTTRSMYDAWNAARKVVSTHADSGQDL